MKRSRQSKQAVLSAISVTDKLEFVPSEFCSKAIIYFFGFINKFACVLAGTVFLEHNSGLQPILGADTWRLSCSQVSTQP